MAIIINFEMAVGAGISQRSFYPECCFLQPTFLLLAVNLASLS